MIDISISIVNFNTKDSLMDCIVSLKKHIQGLSYEIIVADNASVDGSKEMLKSDFPEVKIIENRENLGVTKARNQTFNEASGRYVLVLDSDIEIRSQSVNRMFSFIENNKAVGMVGPRVFFADGSPQHSCNKKAPDLFSCFLNRVFFFAGARYRFYKTPFGALHLKTRYKKAEEFSWLGGMCLLIRKQVIDELGGMDENYFLYYDDTDFCISAKKNNWKVYYLPDAEVVHHLSKSVKKFSSYLYPKIIESELYFFRKHYGKKAEAACRNLILFSMFEQIFLYNFLLLFFWKNGNLLNRRKACSEVISLLNKKTVIKPLRALFVFSVSQIWGGEVVWLKFLKRLDRQRIKPYALVFGSGPLVDELKLLGVDCFLFGRARMKNPLSYIFYAVKMFFLLKKERFDVINSLGVHMMSTVLTSILHLPYIIHFHSIHKLPFLDRWCVRRAKRIITVSRFSRDFLIEHRISPEYVENIYNGIDINAFLSKGKELPHKHDLREELNIASDARIICYIGRIVEHKNLKILIEALALLKSRDKDYTRKIKLLFVGETPKRRSSDKDFRERLEILAKFLNVRDSVLFTGKRADVINILRQIDVFVMPSLLEVCSLAILEAMIMAKPVVAMEAGGNPELVTSETGILVKPRDFKGLADAIELLLDDPQKATLMGEAASERVKKIFNIEAHVERMQEVLEETAVKGIN